MTVTSRNWLIKFAATFVLLFGCCWAAPRLFASIPQFRPVTTGQAQEEIFDQYFKLPKTEVVIAGSSLSWHLRDWYFEKGNVRNVALPGGSSLTALAIIDAAPSAPPRALAVESNVLDRSVDRNLLEKFSHAKRPLPPLPLMRTIAAWYEGARSDTLPYGKERIRAILASPPAPDRSNMAVASIWDDWNRSPRRETLLQQAELLKSLVEKLEAKGVRVFFFEMPYPSRLSESRYAIASHDAFAEVVPPGDKRRLTLDYSLSELRSEADGVHLDDRSSVVFAQALDKAIAAKLAEAAR